MQDTRPSEPGTPEPETPRASRGRDRRKIPLDAHAAGLLGRFLRDWIYPRWREIAWATLLTGALAAATGGYPLVIKFAFDTLMKGDSAWLPWVLAAIIAITAARSIFLYLQTVAIAVGRWRRFLPICQH